MADVIADFLERLAGRPLWTPAPVIQDGEVVSYDAVIEDAEMDLFHVEWADGAIQINSSGNKYIMLFPQELRKLAKLCSKMDRLMAELREGMADDPD